MEDLVHYCTRPKAESNSASGCPQQRGVLSGPKYNAIKNINWYVSGRFGEVMPYVFNANTGVIAGYSI